MQTVSTLRYAQVKVEGVGGKPRVSALDPTTATKVLSLDWQGDTSDRTLIDLRDNQTIVDQSFADANSLDVGDRIRMLTQTGKRPSLEIVGEVKDNADLLGVTVVTQRTMARQLGVREDTLDLIKLAPGANAAQVQSRLKTVMEKAFPTADVLNQEELKQSQESQVNQLLGPDLRPALAGGDHLACSGSPTHWRSRSTSAPASWACCVRSGCRAAR